MRDYLLACSIATAILEQRQQERDSAAAVLRVTRDHLPYKSDATYLEIDVEVDGEWDCISERIDVSLAMGAARRSLLFPLDGVYLMHDDQTFTWWGAEAMTAPRWPRRVLHAPTPT